MNKIVHTALSTSSDWLDRKLEGRRLHVSDISISREEFARHQRRSAERDLDHIISRCWDRYRYARRLIDPGADGEIPSTPPDLSHLYLSWDKICVAYRRYLFDPQIDLFEEQQARELARWHAFKRRYCFAPVLESSVYTRCILEWTGLLEGSTRVEVTPGHGVFERILTHIEERYGSHDRIKH